ncbi:RagB/SusD family nutrient uptake outer membrane protein [Mariniphaga sediminis]|uniref:RagB/SusD family nutrient uptake outer membrane protein n=1 Tax=Mariniphaga sediminis TaxID=1628158 RepID=A0A399D610_9BACT|nr:RagB/SusD family nutrient uptake outer membrane protein [Mariniphaga sediminis]RIH67017.1 RagB/SusD family nutrient uptake outer membrane protein [Mariniphaga sediminis]
MTTENLNRIAKKNLLILVLMILLTPACKENYLVENPKTSLSEAIFWQSEEEAHQALMGCYAYNGGWPERLLDLDKTMIYMSHWAGYSSWRDFGYGREREISPIHGTITTLWRNAFKKIARTNYFLDNIDKVDMDETRKTAMKGEVKFLRAFTYFWLLQLWENVPLIKTTLTADQANSISQASKEELVNFILTELTEAAQNLPVKQAASAKGRVEKGAALALKGRLLLAEEKWSEAAVTYKEIMDLNRYIIDPRYKELFEDEGENSDEIIFANQYMENELGETITQHIIKSSLYGGFNGCNIFQHVLDKFPMVDGESISVSGIYDPENPFQNRDPRLYSTVLITGYSEVNGKIFEGDPETIAKTGQTGPNITGYILQKFWDKDYEGNPRQYGGDYPQIRYAEILLSRLEAELEAGNSITQELLDNTINLVRQREAINMPIVTETNLNKLRDIVRRERAIELTFEGGIDYFDLKRWRTLKEEASQELHGMKITDNPDEYEGLYAITEDGHLIIGSIEFHDHNYLWPIPLPELDINDNLHQNPGYN